MSSYDPVVAIVGRPNVGKSTLFNRIIQKKKSIIHHEAGITRDRVYEIVNWSGRQFMLIDTGGFIPESTEKIDTAIRAQVRLAVEEADLIIFLVDSRESLTSMDMEIASLLRNSGKNVIITANKNDNAEMEKDNYDLYELGFDTPALISALNGRRIGDLLDLVLEKLPNPPEEREIEHNLQVAIVGIPNAGKSSLVNSLLGFEKVIVTDIPGTTRDSIDSHIKYFGDKITIIDTAGIRKKRKISSSVEFYSSVRSEKALERCHVAIVVIDGEKGITRQDQIIINNVISRKKGLILAINKWDLVTKETNTVRDYKAELVWQYKSLEHYPIIFISALTKQRIFKLLDLAKSIYQKRVQKINTRELNIFFQKVITKTPPPAVKGSYIKIKYVTQLKIAPPVFGFFCNHPKLVTDDYKRFLENQLRSHYDFEGVPMILRFKEK